jgi:glycosyltransferase involved in cell wall biosynthesis
MDNKSLVKKAQKVLKEEGVEMLLRKSHLYLRNYLHGQRAYSNIEWVQACFNDVLFINGCYLDHPSRYRVSHQREQLEANNITTAEIFYQEISIDFVKNFRAFVFFRCPYTELIGEFIEKAKKYNKTVIFDIDDLMIDTKYTNTIPYVKSMSVNDKKLYDDGVIATGRLLSMCDMAITTTEALAEELQKYVSDVTINRNVASEQMVKLSEEALKRNFNKNGNKVKIGYFSGSITHNPDFAIVLPALVRLMEKYSQVELLLVGELDIPVELKTFKERITVSKMINWQKLPDLISEIDINIAPLEDTIFNRAKSENKWIEASLVKVPTVASRVGAFEKMIENGKTGILCENTVEDWYGKLELLVQNLNIRTELAENAHHYVYAHCTSVYAGTRYSDYIYNKMRPNIVFVLPVIQISGGALVVLKHSSMLQQQGYDVTIFNEGYEKVTELEQDGNLFPVISKREIRINAFIDKCVVTLWSTSEFFNQYGKIGKRYYLIQNYETDFYKPGDILRIRANQTYRLRMPVKHITISKWCQDWLREKYNVESYYAPNGLDTERFYPVERDFKGKIRILVEGNSEDYYKNVDESFQITNQLDPDIYEIWYMSYQGKPKNWYRIDKFLHKIPYIQVPEIYRECHILIKSSILESFSYPPLEMMATGGCVVVAPNGGNVEYLRNRENCLFYQLGNVVEARERIQEILESESLRTTIINGGIAAGKTRTWNNIRKDVLALYEE